MDITIPRVVALVVALGYVVVLLAAGVGPRIFGLLGYLGLALSCIWCPEAMASLTGFFKPGFNAKPVLPGIASAAGWFLLVGVPLVVLLLSA